MNRSSPLPEPLTCRQLFKGVVVGAILLVLAMVRAGVGRSAEAPGGKTYYYVAPTGADSNPGTEAMPFKTIQKAAESVNPGDTVIVKDGSYARQGPKANAVVSLSRGGNAKQWITFKSENQWGARIDGENNTTNTGWVFNSGANYIRVEGFDVHGLKELGFQNYLADAHHLEVAGNRLHDIGRWPFPGDMGLDGIFIQNKNGSTLDLNMVIEGNQFHDIGRFDPGEQGAAYPRGNTNYQNHDHGIYIAGAHGVTIRNNLFWNFKHGWGIQIYNRDSSRIKVVHNTFAFPNPYDRSGQLVIYEVKLSDCLIANNIFYQPGGGTAINIGGSPTFRNVQVHHNLTTAGKLAEQALTGMTLEKNLTGTNPLLVNPAGFDFHLQMRSPAIGAGGSLSEVRTDFEGRSRPQGATPDIGAFEFMDKVDPGK